MQSPMPGTRGGAYAVPEPRQQPTQRRAQAYHVGESKARRREISADAFLFLYKELVNLCGERSYCWPGLDYLAATLETSEGTIKRWMRELDATGLIRRKARPGGLTTLTYVTAYLQDTMAEPEDAPIELVPGLFASSSAVPRIAAAQHPPLAAKPGDEQLPEAPVDPGVLGLFFGPATEISSDRSAGSTPIPPPVKNHESKNGGGGWASPGKDATAQLLEREQIVSDEALRTLQAKPGPELEVISRYLDRQRNVVNRPGLFVWLARHDFGSVLLQKGWPATKRHGRVAQTTKSTPPSASASNLPAGMEAPSSPAAARWSKVQECLQRSMLPAEYATWIEPLQLVQLACDEAVIAAPNVFVRDQVRTVYAQVLAECFASELGFPVQVEVSIASTCVA